MKNEKVFKDWVRKSRAEGKADRTISTSGCNLRRFLEWFGDRDIETINEEDVYNYLDYLLDYTFIRSGKKCKYKEGTIYREKAVLKQFLGSYKPELAKLIKLKISKNDKLPEEILTFEEIEKLIAVCLSTRDRALISTFYESGARKGELLACQVKHVAFDENGTVLTIQRGKTGSRRVRLVFATSYLRQWLETHPKPNDKEAPLFCSLQGNFGIISETGLREQLWSIAERAGIDRHRVYPHAFRHARATHLSKKLTEQQIKDYLGWTRDSRMAGVYVHLSGRDSDNAILEMYGIKPVDKEKEPTKVGRCPRCKEINPETSIYCGKCGLPLSDESAKTITSDVSDIAKEFMNKISDDPDLLIQLLAKLNSIKKE